MILYIALHSLKYITKLKDGSGWQFTNKGKSIIRWKNYNKLALAVQENLDEEDERTWFVAEEKAKDTKERQRRAKKELTAEEIKDKERKRRGEGIGRIIFKENVQPKVEPADRKPPARKISSARKRNQRALSKPKAADPRSSTYGASNKKRQEVKNVIGTSAATADPRAAARAILELRKKAKSKAN